MPGIAPDHRPARPCEELLDPAELRGFLVRSLRAAREVEERGGCYSGAASVERAYERLRLATDTVAAFAEDCLLFDEGATVPRQLVYNTYIRWAEAQGVDAEPQHEFNERLQTFDAVRCRPRRGERRVRSWCGVRIMDDETAQ